MYVQDHDLRNHLVSRGNEIGHSKTQASFNTLTALAFLISAWTGDIPFQQGMILLGVLATIWSIIDIQKAFIKPYNHEILWKEIKSMDQIKHKFSLIAVKDTFCEYSNRFLVYWDARWECWLLLNFRTPDNNEVEVLARRTAETLHVPVAKTKLQWEDVQVYTKFSVSDRIRKVYEHNLYIAKITSWTETLKQRQFVLDGVEYKWMTLREMKNDSNIMKKNRDVVAMLEKEAA